VIHTPFRPFSSGLELGDELLCLRPWGRAGDQAELLSAYQDLDVPPAWAARTAPLGKREAQDFLTRCRRGWTRGDQVSFAIMRRDDGVLLGHISLWAAEAGLAQFGFWLKRSARHQGYLRRAMALLIAWAEQEVGLARLRIITQPKNLGTQKAAQASGFSRVGSGILTRGHLRYTYLIFERALSSHDF